MARTILDSVAPEKFADIHFAQDSSAENRGFQQSYVIYCGASSFLAADASIIGL
jgi:hypothetical protein